jgi:hypothetical protein
LSILATDSSGAADVGTVTISVTDVNDQTPAVTVAATYNHAEAAATTFQTYTIVDTDTAGTYTCTLGGDDAADFSASISGKVCTVVWAANPNYESPADTGGNNVYDITIAFSDGTNDLAAQTTAITVTDVNDEAPVFTSSSTINVAEGATAVATLAATDGDAADAGGLTYAITTDDPGANTQFSLDGTTLTIAAQNYEAPACGSGSDSLTCVVIVSATDAAGTATSQTITVTITDVNDQTPAVTVAATYNHAEAASTTFQTYTIVDSDTSGSYTCTLAGTDAADFTRSITGKVCTVSWAANPNFESPADNGGDNVYDITIAFSDGTNNLGAQTTAITVTDVNDEAPVFTSATSANVAEGATAVVTLAATDGDAADSGGLAYAIVTDDPGANTQFALSGVTLTIAAQDYENPACGSGSDSLTCVVIVSATDDAGTATQQTITVTITDVNDQTPAVTVAATYSHAEAAATTFQTYTIVDTDTAGAYTCTLGGDDAADFTRSITGKVCTVSWAANPNYEAPADADTDNVYDITIAFSDGTNDLGAQTTAITVTDVNDQAPAFTSSDTINVAEGATAVATLAATDTDTADSGGLAYAIVTDDPGSGTQFALSGTTLTIAAQNYESPACGSGSDSLTCVVIVSATDDAGTATQQTITVTITDVNDQTPVFSSSSSVNVAEGTTAVVTLAATDTDTADSGGLTYAIVTDDLGTGTQFSLTGAALSFSNAPNFDSPGCGADSDSNTCTVIVSATDAASQSVQQTITVTVTDVGVTITASQTCSVTESAANAAAVCTVATSGDNPTLFAITAGNTDSIFSIANSGAITVGDNTNLDYDTTTSYSLTVVASDATSADAETVVVNIGDVNDQAPVFTSATSANVAEGATAVLTLAATDTDTADSGGLTYAVVTDDPGDGTQFTVTGTALAIAAQNYESPACGGDDDSLTCVVIVSATDAAGTATQQTITVTITDVNDQTPAVTVAATYNHAEAAATTFQTYTIVDSDTSGSYTCTLGGDDAADFSASISNKVCTVTWAANPDYEAPADTGGDNVYDITIAFSDGTNNLGAQTTAITVTDVNDQAPAFTSSNAINVAEGATAVVTLAAADTDTADSGGLTYAVVTDDAGTGTQFTVTGTALTIAAQNYEAPACGSGSDSLTCTVIVSATDAAGAATQQTITVTITDVNDQTPAVTVAATYNHAEAASLTFQAYTMVDTDTTGTYACTLGGDDAADFTKSVSGKVCTVSWAANPNYEAPADADTDNVYDITIAFSDGTNDLGAQTTAITVTDVNDQAPAFTSSDTINVAEGATAVVTLAATDTDTADSGGLAYAIVTDDPGSGTQFALSGTTLTIAAQNYESPACGSGSDSLTCVVIVSATDDAGTATQQTITVTITDVNDQAPAFTSSNAINVAEGATAVVTLAAADTDTADSGGLTYAIVTDDPGANTQFALSGVTLTIAAQDYENPACGAGS